MLFAPFDSIVKRFASPIRPENDAGSFLLLSLAVVEDFMICSADFRPLTFLNQGAVKINGDDFGSSRSALFFRLLPDIGLFTLDYPLLSILVLVDSAKKFIIFVTKCNVRRFDAANTIFELYKAVYLAKGASRLTSGHESFL